MIRYDEIIGYLGMFLLLLAFFLISTKKMKVNSYSYPLINLIAAFFLLVNTVTTQSWPTVVLNSFWLLISLVSLVKISIGVKNKKK
ncbi:hypothetical protein HZA33_05445 [Candidatus Pacearchaeota archaeon]|nr:hypothetical protein [Candidatus Pacearchaeota archaeon]